MAIRNQLSMLYLWCDMAIRNQLSMLYLWCDMAIRNQLSQSKATRIYIYVLDLQKRKLNLMIFNWNIVESDIKHHNPNPLSH
jgi:hypothetical protein